MHSKSLFLLIGVLSLGLIFAFSPQHSTNAQRPDAPSFAQRGPYAVGTQELQIADDERPLEATIWYPADNPDGLAARNVYQYTLISIEGRALVNAAPNISDGPYPLVIFSHGSGGLRYQSVYLTEHLASYGFVVMAVDHVGNTILEQGELENFTDFIVLRPQDVLRQIEFAAEVNDSDLGGMIDLEQIAVVGHSFGGYTTMATGGAQLNTPAIQELGRYGDTEALLNRLAELRGLEAVPDDLWPSTTDPRIKALIPMAPALFGAFGETGTAPIEVPTMIMVGGADSVTPLTTNAQPFYDSISSSHRALVVFENAEHYIFAIECPASLADSSFFEICSDPVWDMARVHDLINHFAAAFLRSVFYADDDAMAALDGANVDFIGVQYQREIGQ